MTDSKPIATYLSLRKRHLDLLQNVDSEDKSKAARIIFDSIINGQEQTRRKKLLDNSIMWSCFGSIFLFISYLLEPTLQIISIMMGTFLFAYGIIGGVQIAVSSTKQHRRNKHE